MAKTDTETFQPFELIDNRDSEFSDVRLSFSNWSWMDENYGQEINDYYLNGYGVQGLVLAARINNNLPAYSDTMEPMSEGDTCYIIFEDYDEAIQTAKIAAEMINDKSLLPKIIDIARNNELED